METLHFKVGSDAGKLLMQIAIEKIIYNHTPEEAIKTFQDSFGEDCPIEIILKLITGEYVLEVDVENQMFGVETERDEVLHQDYPKFNIKEYYTRQAQEILEAGNGLKDAINLARAQSIKSDYKISFDFGTIIDFCNDNKEALNNDILEQAYDEDSDGSKVSNLLLLVKFIKDYITKTTQVQETLHWLRKTYPSEFIGEESFIPKFEEYQNILSQVSTKFSELLQGDYVKRYNVRKYKEVDEFITAQITNDKILAQGIKPVNIFDNYSAGYLSPEGTFYGMNGHIANMLHIQIADGLFEAGVIPKDFDKDFTSKDAWLDQTGWVKIHGAFVKFEGSNNFRLNKPNVNLTQIQIKKIYEYIQICHKGTIKLGWKQQFISAAMFQDIANSNVEAINKKYFEWT